MLLNKNPASAHGQRPSIQETGASQNHAHLTRHTHWQAQGDPDRHAVISESRRSDRHTNGAATSEPVRIN